MDLSQLKLPMKELALLRRQFSDFCRLNENTVLCMSGTNTCYTVSERKNSTKVWHKVVKWRKPIYGVFQN